MDCPIDIPTTPAATGKAGGVEEDFDRRQMKGVVAGDARSLERLLERHGPMVARLIGRLLAWHDDSQDVFQEVWITVWKRAGSWRGDGSFEGWLRRIAVHRCRNHMRTAMRWERRWQRWVTLQPPETAAAPPELYSDRPTGPLAQALQQLSPQDRRVVVLYYLEELPGQEVAALLNLRPATLHVRLHRIRNRLKELLEILEPPDER